MNSPVWFTWSNAPTLILSVVGVALLIWLMAKFGGQFRAFVAEVAVELGKCTWPWNPQEKGIKRYKELIDSTVVVAISALLLAGFVTGSDFILVKVIGFLTRFHT